MEKQVFTGITIGPIYDTMQLTSTPGGLWGASYLFSWITKELISSLIQSGIGADRFVSPAVSWEKEQVILKGCEEARSVGVGLFHDRVIFQGAALEEVRAAKRAVASRLAGELPYSVSREELEGWLNSYLRICAAQAEVAEQDNPLLVLGPVLDALELEPQYVPSQHEDPLLYLFEDVNAKTAGKEPSNEQLKQSFLVGELKSWMLLREDGWKIRDLRHIAANGREQTAVSRKDQLYFAVLQTDGDRMGQTLQSLDVSGGNLSRLRTFSENCLAFCSRASRIILDYGGVPIYAGGDDLLAIVPLTRAENSRNAPPTLLGLVDDLRTCFNDAFSSYEEDVRPTLSAGVAVQYYKSPLYEALDRAASLLHEAKHAPGKNALRLDLQKHSGQSIRLDVDRLDSPGVLPALDAELRRAVSGEAGADALEFLSSAGYQIERFRDLFRLAVAGNSRDVLKNLMDNLFDNVGQTGFREGYLSQLEELAWQIMQNARSSREAADKPVDDGEYRASVIRRIESAIRFIHFMRERPEAAEKEASDE